MGILSWIILGLIAGAIAKWLRPGKDPQGCIITILIGIVGAFVGGWIGSLLGLGSMDEFSFRTLLLAIGGSILVLWIYAMVSKRR
ncbi:MAG: GlsB/YeaQ/YmgE family stress response membrane protein [Bacteroidia bacterium]|nr:GlsB/YeaQ/YmgE family stress response membrane protein [Bacteroidia bacterium]